MDEDLWTDTAGAIPSNGVVVRGLRTLITSRTRELTTGSFVTAVAEFLAFRGARNFWFDVVVERAGTGERLAARTFRSLGRAKAARARFVTIVETLSDDDLATADIPALLDRAATRR